MIIYILSFALLLGPLIFIHELGHFLFARLFNVRVDAFSMGFGPKIFKKKKGETEYCLSLIPLGGYVKLLGQDPNEEVPAELNPRTLNFQAPWKRFLIYLGGPLFNFLFAVIIFGSMMIMGEPQISSVLERVPSQSDAYLAGFRSGDEITAINHEPLNKFEQINKVVSESTGKELEFTVKRKNETMSLKATPKSAPGMSIYGELIEVGSIEGLLAVGRHSVIGVSDPASLAAKAGLKTGDEIVAVNGAPIKSYEELEVEFARVNPHEQVTLTVVPHDTAFWQSEGKAEANPKNKKEIKLARNSLENLGIYSSELFIANMVKGSPAENVGLLAGDRLVSIETKKLITFNDLRENVQTIGEKKGKFTIEVERLGKLIRKDVTPSFNETKDMAGNPARQFLIGIYPLFIQSEPNMFIEKTMNPIKIVLESWGKSFDLTAKTFISLKKLVTREVSVGTLGGPLLIGKLAGDSMEKGLTYFLKVMGLISISLAVFNILPIPVLDGGHIVLLLCEVVRGKPFSLKQAERVQQVGLTLILCLLVVVMFNDISRVGLPAIRRMLE